MGRSGRRLSLAVPVLAALLAALVAPAAGTSSGAAGAGLSCPAGTVKKLGTTGERAFEGLAGAVGPGRARCLPVRRVRAEPFPELAAVARTRAALSAGPMGYTPPGALRTALAAQARMQAAAAAVPGAGGTFRPLGTTPLIADDPNAPSVNGLGLGDQAGRVDSLVYDDVNGRLFSAPGTGGVWMSRDLGASWTSVGDRLPYQSVGSIAWSPDGTPADGTLVVLSGEASAGGNVYTGIGAFFSTDSGASWARSTGIPDGLMGFKVKVDPTDPKKVYAATSQGLYRSTDAGRTYANVVLPTGECAGRTGYDNICQNANWVTDVVIRTPGGVGADKTGGQVVAVVGYRAGRRVYPGTTTPQSPANGLYRSATGAPGSFVPLDVYGDGVTPAGFAPQERVGRTELGAATGPNQDHGYLYAVVQDAVLFNGGVPGIDAADTTDVVGAAPNNTSLNGIYVSPDFGTTWTRMADELELQLPITESALVGTSQTAGMYAPGVQSWYNQWIAPDPTTATASGVPTRLVFGLEEVWATRLEGTAQDGATQAAEPASFKVIGPYFAGSTCAFMSNPLPYCPTQQTATGDFTTHPDQQSGLWVPTPGGGVALVVGNDGGNYVQKVAAGAPLTKTWGRGNQAGINANTLLPYDAQVAKDGTVAFGLQDNGSGVIRPDGRVVETFGGDGFFAAIDPDNSQTYYNETTLADMRVTTDGGQSYTPITPPVTAPLFANPFVMDPTDANHLLTAGPEVVETVRGPATAAADTTTGSPGDWVQVFDLNEGDPALGRQMSAVELQGAAAYVGFCSTCDIVNKDPATGAVFSSGIATNVGGSAPAAKASPAGWHIAAAKGLPDRYITSLKVDPADPRTVYATLSGYANRQWWPAGAFNDKNPNIGEGQVFRSTDAGETFTNITGTLPDVPARWVELNGRQLLVGNDIGVFLSSDTAGSRWAPLAGLPAVPVTGITNSPADPNVVVVSTFGRGVYEYRFSDRLGAGTPAAPAAGTTAGPSAGTGARSGTAGPPATRGAAGRPTLATTGLPPVLGAVALLAMAGAAVLRRRAATSR